MLNGAKDACVEVTDPANCKTAVLNADNVTAKCSVCDDTHFLYEEADDTQHCFLVTHELTGCKTYDTTTFKCTECTEADEYPDHLDSTK